MTESGSNLLAIDSYATRSVHGVVLCQEQKFAVM